MANRVPLSTLTTPDSGAGAYLVQPEYAEVLLSRVAREAAVLQLADSMRVDTNQVVWPVYLGRPVAGFVAEAGVKPPTGAEFGQLTANIKKIATYVRFTEEILEDARRDPRLLINPDVEAAIADLIDYHALGTHAGAGVGTFGTSFDAALQNTTSGGLAVELGTGADALATAISAAIAKLEANGYTRNLSILGGYAVKQHLRDARQTTGAPLYTDDFSADVPGLYGLRWAFSTNVNRTDTGVYAPFTAGTVGTAGSPSRTVAIVGDFSRAKAVIRKDINTRVLTEATLGGVSLAETNQIAIMYEMRMGFQVYDLNNAFVRIVNGT
jgi:HK97 family phage major capsid protein